MTGDFASPSFRRQISVSVVTYNSAHCLPVFLDSLRQQTHSSWEVFFFDNASQDGTPDLLRQAGLGELFVSEENIGYGRAHNRSFRRCGGDYVMLMNPDLQFGPDLFSALLDNLRANPGHALVGPRILEGPAKRPFAPRHFYPGEGMIALEPGIRRSEISWLNGCCLILRREALHAIGGFDADYFLYQEETDLCLRARRAGYRIGYAPDAVVHHLHRQSQRELSDYEYARRVFQGSAIFWEKHYASRDVQRMVRYQYWLCRLLLVLGRVHPGLCDRPEVLSESRLKARRDVCAEWLMTHGLPKAGLTGLPGKIALRQGHLAVEWVLQGKFPIDDF